MGTNELLAHLIDTDAEELVRRRERLRDALAGFDAATIATVHQFCNIVLKSLGVAGDSDAGMQLVENLEDLVAEIVDDLYLKHFGNVADKPKLSRDDAMAMARAIAGQPGTELRPKNSHPETEAAVRLAFAADFITNLDHRKRLRGVLGYDDLLTRLADALDAPDSPPRSGCASGGRW